MPTLVVERQTHQTPFPCDRPQAAQRVLTKAQYFFADPYDGFDRGLAQCIHRFANFGLHACCESSSSPFSLEPLRQGAAVPVVVQINSANCEAAGPRPWQWTAQCHALPAFGHGRDSNSRCLVPPHQACPHAARAQRRSDRLCVNHSDDWTPSVRRGINWFARPPPAHCNVGQTRRWCCFSCCANQNR